MNVQYDVYSNTFIVEAKDSIIENISMASLKVCLFDTPTIENIINPKISFVAVNCHILNMDLPNVIISKLDLSGCVVKGSVNFYNARFLNDIMCVGTIFLDEVTFLCASFEGYVRFDYAVFEGELDFSYIEGVSMSFQYSRFNNKSYWDDLNISGILWLENSVFMQSVYLVDCVIEGKLILKDAIGRIDFKVEGIHTGSIDLSGIEIDGEMTIRNIKNYKNKLAVRMNEQLYFDVYDSRVVQ